MTGQPLIDHVTLLAGDLPASRRFYEAALAPLGFGLEFERDDLLAFGSGESGRLILYAVERRVAGVPLAFSAPSREAVNAFHAAAMEARKSRSPRACPSLARNSLIRVTLTNSSRLVVCLPYVRSSSLVG